MNEQEVLKRIDPYNVIITNSHVVYTSGNHGSTYFNKDAIYQSPGLISMLCREIAWQYKDENIEVVIGPAIGGVILSQWIAYHLTALCSPWAKATYAERSQRTNELVIKRHYDKLIRGKRALVVEDVLNTGKTAKELVNLVRTNDGTVVGLAALCNRGDIAPEHIGYPPRLTALIHIKVTTWNKKDCPLCQQDVPINTDVGKGYEFIDSRS